MYYKVLQQLLKNNALVRPEFIERPSIEIDKGRHAVVEKVMGAQTYIPNSISMDENVNVQLITGPNMSGEVNLYASISDYCYYGSNGFLCFS